MKILGSAVRFHLWAPLIPYFPTYICTLVRTSSSPKHECTPYSVSVSLALFLVADLITQGATREMFTMVLSSCTSTLLGSQRSSQFRIYFQLILQTIHQSDQLQKICHLTLNSFSGKYRHSSEGVQGPLSIGALLFMRSATD